MQILIAPFVWIGEVIVTGISAIGEVICILLNTLKQVRYIHKNPVLIVKQMLYSNSITWWPTSSWVRPPVK